MFFAYFALWYFVGLIGSFCGEKVDFDNGSDITIGSIISNLAVALLGPITFILGVGYYVMNNINFDRVVIKSKKKQKETK